MRLTFIFIGLLIAQELSAQFAPAAGYPGSDAMPADSSCFVNWANRCTVVRGYMNLLDSSLGLVTTGDDAFGIGRALDNPTVSLGDGGEAMLEFPYPIINGPGPDFAVFENAFIDSFLELATVSVSSDGINYYTFPAVCHTDTSSQLGTFGLTDATKLYNLAGKHRSGFGVPFDLEQLRGNPGLNLSAITHIRIKDVVGILSPRLGTRDSEGRLINDPWPTPFPSGGFDLDAVGVIWDQQHNGIQGGEYVSFSVGPNPANENITISAANPSSILYLKDTQGRTLMELKAGVYPIKHLPSGLYYISSTQSTFKIVIQH